MAQCKEMGARHGKGHKSRQAKGAGKSKGLLSKAKGSRQCKGKERNAKQKQKSQLKASEKGEMQEKGKGRKARQGKARQGKARQGKARQRAIQMLKGAKQSKAKQSKARQGKRLKEHTEQRPNSKTAAIGHRPSAMWRGFMRQLATQGKEKGVRQGAVIFAAASTDKISAFPDT
jgi:hypothetical protein